MSVRPNTGTTSGGGVVYTEGDTDATVTGKAILWEDAADVLRSVSAAKPLPVTVAGGTGAGTEYTEGDADASITGPALMWEDSSDTLRAVSAAKPLPVAIKTLGQAVAANSVPTVLASDQWSSVVEVRVSPTVSNGSAYAAGDCVGGIMTIANAVVSSGKSGRIGLLMVMEKGDTPDMVPLDVVFFHTPPVADGDNNAFDPSDAEMQTCIGVISTGPYYEALNNAISVRECALPFKSVGGTTIYAQAVVPRTASGAGLPNYTSTSELEFTFLIYPDV